MFAAAFLMAMSVTLIGLVVLFVLLRRIAIRVFGLGNWMASTLAALFIVVGYTTTGVVLALMKKAERVKESAVFEFVNSVGVS